MKPNANQRFGRCRGESGFSTIEALIGFFILAMTLSGMIQLIATSTKLVQRSAIAKLDQSNLAEIQSFVLPDLLEKAEITSQIEKAEHKSWIVTATPFADEANESELLGQYGTLYHVKIEKHGDDPSSVQASYDTFRLISKTSPVR